MNAKEMFEKLGFFQYANNKKFICYTGEYESGWKRIKFKLEKKKLTIHSDVNIDMLQAILKQCEELGWMLHERYEEDDYDRGFNDCIRLITGKGDACKMSNY